MRTRTKLLAVISVVVIAACGGKDATLEEKRKASDDVTLYEAAQRNMSIGSYERAIAQLEQLELYFPFSEYTRRARLDLIYANFKVGNTESAIDAANEFIRENPIHPNVDYAYYLRGLIYFERDASAFEKLFGVDLTTRPPSDAERALSYFAQLVRSYPESDYAPDARQRIVHLRERIARFHNHVARYYMDRRAWIAAAARARTVVEEFQDTTEVGAALQIMATSYRKLDMNDLAEDAERVLRENNLAVEKAPKEGFGLFKRNRKAVPEKPAS